MYIKQKIIELEILQDNSCISVCSGGEIIVWN